MKKQERENQKKTKQNYTSFCTEPLYFLLHFCPDKRLCGSYVCLMLLNIWSDTRPSLSQGDLFIVSAKSYLHFAISDISYRCCFSYGSPISTLEAAFSSHSRSASTPQAPDLQNN